MWHTPGMIPRSPRNLPSVLFLVIAILLGAPAYAQGAEEAPGVPPAAAEAIEAVEGAVEDTAAAVEEAAEGSSKEMAAWEKSIDDTMKSVNEVVGGVIFFPIPIPGTTAKSPTPIPFSDGGEFSQVTIQFAVLWLVLGAIFFTFRMGFVQLKLVGHAVKVVSGKYDEGDHDDSDNQVTHFQALSAALSATVGLGNIASVAIAVAVGGPGATFWMVVAGFLGMASKFTECSLGQLYREERADGSVMGGAMYYLSNGLRELGLGGMGKILAVLFALLCIGGSFAGGNSFQVNQSLGALGQVVPFFEPERGNAWVYGLIMTAAVGAVILGGLKRIADVASTIVPAMCALYVSACLYVILTNADQVGAAFGTIFDNAFSKEAGIGGAIGVLIMGFKRAAFSNEAGVGSAAIAHSAAKTKYPVREGIVALLEPLIDTVIICTMTALVIVISGAYQMDGFATAPEYQQFISDEQGAGLTLTAFSSHVAWFKYVLAVAVVLFAFSTMISWSYYGERCFSWLVGDGYSMVYKVLFLAFTFIGSIVSGVAVLEFGDLMILGMAIPNIVGVVLLSGKVRRELDAYVAKKRAGEL